MLILSRRPGECLLIGDEIKISVVEIRGHQVKIGIEAPRHVEVYREEIYNRIKEEKPE